MAQYFGFKPHDFREACQTGPSVHEYFHEICQLADRCNERCYVKIKCDQIRIVHVAAHDQPSAESHYGNGHDAQKKLQRRVENPERFIVIAFRCLESLVCRTELLVIFLFVCKGFACAYPGKPRFDFTVDFRQTFLDSARCQYHASAAKHYDDHGNGDNNQNHKCQLPLDSEHYDDCPDDSDACYEQILRSMVGHLGYFKQVSGHARQKLSGTVLIKKLKIQILKM